MEQILQQLRAINYLLEKLSKEIEHYIKEKKDV